MANKLAKLGDAIAISKSEIVTDSLTDSHITAEYRNIPRNHILSSCRYDELGEGRASASNSDQTGTLSRYQTAAFMLT